MSPSESELIAELQRGIAAYNRGDFDSAARAFHADIELLPAGGQPAIRGAEAVRAWMEPDAFASQVVETLEFTASGNQVLAHVITRAVGAESGVAVEMAAWNVWTCGDDGLWIRAQIFLPHEEKKARQAAGLD